MLVVDTTTITTVSWDGEVFLAQCLIINEFACVIQNLQRDCNNHRSKATIVIEWIFSSLLQLLLQAGLRDAIAEAVGCGFHSDVLRFFSTIVALDVVPCGISRFQRRLRCLSGGCSGGCGCGCRRR